MPPSDYHPKDPLDADGVGWPPDDLRIAHDSMLGTAVEFESADEKYDEPLYGLLVALYYPSEYKMADYRIAVVYLGTESPPDDEADNQDRDDDPEPASVYMHVPFDRVSKT